MSDDNDDNMKDDNDNYEDDDNDGDIFLSPAA